ncbi:MAG TPA: DUF2163 domain-containing protein [Alphaproteobacteria bacterium]|nr:DUF2163 domain-containing protein [Alphaproteobacteria bacterium]
MKSVSPALQAHLNGELTTLAYLVKLTREDGVVKGFTTCDQNLVLGGVTYKADGAITPSAIESSSGLATDNLEVTGILNSADITDADIEAGLYDYAHIDVYACNWADLTQGSVQLRRGWLGQVECAGSHYVAELRGLHDLLQRPIGEYYTPECRYDLGDSRCTINLASITVTGSVTSVTDNTSFTDTSRSEATGTFNYGKLTWTSGANNGLSMEVKGWDASLQAFTLWLPMPYAIQIHDTYSVYPGCDKRFTTCQSTFNNAVNFGGFPYVPGVGNILQYPDAH